MEAETKGSGTVRAFERLRIVSINLHSALLQQLAFSRGKETSVHAFDFSRSKGLLRMNKGVLHVLTCGIWLCLDCAEINSVGGLELPRLLCVTNIILTKLRKQERSSPPAASSELLGFKPKSSRFERQLTPVGDGDSEDSEVVNSSMLFGRLLYTID